MAEKPGELTNIDKLDPIATTAGAGTDPFFDKYVDDSDTNAETWDMRANTGETPEETEQIKAQIEETRKEMGETIDAIQEKLSFANVSEQVSEHVSNAIETAKDSIYEATLGKAVGFMKNAGKEISDSNVMNTVRSNPFPLLLIGLGAGLLAYQGMGKGRQMRRFNGRRDFGDDYARERYALTDSYASGRNAERRGGSTIDSTKRSIVDMKDKAYDSVTNAAGSAYEGVTHAAESAYEGVTETVSSVYGTAEEMAMRARERAEEYGQIAYEKYDYYLEENPLAIGAVALGLGAAIGFAIPSTQYEGRLMGEARENLMQKATDAAGNLVDKAKHVADEAGRTIKEEGQKALDAK